jgi:hypothetical protein
MPENADSETDFPAGYDLDPPSDPPADSSEAPIMAGSPAGNIPTRREKQVENRPKDLKNEHSGGSGGNGGLDTGEGARKVIEL